MKVLVIPDIHLKPWIFQRASGLMNSILHPELAVCLGDLPDDFGQQHNIELYNRTFDSAINFAKEFSNTLWCYGNHDVCYKWNYRESGYSEIAAKVVQTKLSELESITGKNHKFVHKIDDVVFSHAGLSDSYVSCCVHKNEKPNIDLVVANINKLPSALLWLDNSPIWFRPQIQHNTSVYYPRKLLQIVGHTPMKKIEKHRGVLSCDSFSTHRDGSPYGEQKFVIVDTKTKEWFTAE